ncbi:MAG: glycosyltransferase [Deltaproteobacteria bacterium]|nr:glycosyltransferase [Deltaproteobacteria bacterium]
MLGTKPKPSDNHTSESPAALRIAMFSIHSCPMGKLGTRDTGGMNVYVREVARELGRRGHHVDVYTRFHGDGHGPIMRVSKTVRFIHIEVGENRRIHKLAIYPHLSGLFCKIDTLRKQELSEYDLVHSHYWLSGRVGNLAQGKWKIPHLVTFHTLGKIKNHVGVGDSEPRLRIVTEKHLVRSCDRIIVSTERGKQELIHFYNAKPDAIGVIPCGVNLDLFQPMPKSEARSQLGLDQQDTILLYVGRFAALKGLDRLLQAISFLKDHNKLRLIIIGGEGFDSPETVRLKRLSRALGVENRVIFMGSIEHESLPPYYCAADLLVVPSHHESFGLVALESLACGTPVVATKVGVAEVTIKEGKTGFVVSDPAPRVLAEKIGTALTDPQRKFASVDTLRETVTRFSWSNVVDAMMDEYRSVLNGFRLSAVKDTSPMVFRLSKTSSL